MKKHVSTVFLIVIMFGISAMLYLIDQNAYGSLAGDIAGYVGCAVVEPTDPGLNCTSVSTTGSMNTGGSIFGIKGLDSNAFLVIVGLTVLAGTILFPNPYAIFFPVFICLLSISTFPYKLFTATGLPWAIKFMLGMLLIPLYLLAVINFWRNGE